MASALVAVALVVVSCSPDATPTGGPSPEPGPTTVPEPYPFTKPTPPLEPTILDGLYSRRVTPDVVGGPGRCRRCPPYRLEVGEETLTLNHGVFRVHHDRAGYLGLGHYEVDGARITFFNDPSCPKERGVYAWSVREGELTLRVLEDPCAFADLRIRHLTALPWRRTG